MGDIKGPWLHHSKNENFPAPCPAHITSKQTAFNLWQFHGQFAPFDKLQALHAATQVLHRLRHAARFPSNFCTFSLPSSLLHQVAGTEDMLQLTNPTHQNLSSPHPHVPAVTKQLHPRSMRPLCCYRRRRWSKGVFWVSSSIC